MRTASGFRNPMDAARAARWTCANSACNACDITGGATGGGGAANAMSSSRCGFPHLWQNRASSGNRAPQVQNSGTVTSFS